MIELRRRRVRAHVPPPAPSAQRSPWQPAPDEPALLVHLAGDDQERVALATARELVRTPTGLLTISERVYAPADQLDTARAEASGMRPDGLAGLATDALVVDSLEVLGRLICRRSYRQRWPLVAWNPEWTLGRLAAHTGPAHGGGDGFSVDLFGTGTHVDAGRWATSWHYPTLIMRPTSGGAAGAFLSWKHPRNRQARAKHLNRLAAFLSLQTVASALIGGDVEEPEQACRWLGADWSTTHGEGLERLDRLRGEARALTHLYEQALHALMQVAPGLAPQHVHSFGSLADLSLIHI